MSAVEVEPAPQPSQVDQDLAARFVPIIGRMRAEGRFNVEQFLSACEAGMGGTVVVTAPSDRAKRGVPEARYVSEGVFVSGSLSFEGSR